MKMCLKCFAIFSELTVASKSKENSCSDSVHHFVDIDENIAETIQILNRKGYCTAYCCSGHSYEDECEIYIIFEPGVILKNIPPPNGFSKEKRKKMSLENGDKMEYTIKSTYAGENLDFLNKKEYIYASNLKLLMWAIALPTASSHCRKI